MKNGVEYKVEKGKVISENGIPLLPRWFCDERVSYQVDKFGISGVEYFNATTRGDVRVFIADMFGGIRFYIEQNGVNYGQTFGETTVMPYGYKAKWNYKDFVFEHEVRAINDCIYISIIPIKVPDGETLPRDIRFVMEFCDGMCLHTREDGDFRFRNRGVKRNWFEWEYEHDSLIGGYEENTKETRVCFGTNEKSEYQKREVGETKKYIIKSKALNTAEPYVMVIGFDVSKDNVCSRVTDTLKQSENYIKAQNARYQKVVKQAPVLKSPYEALNRFMALAPLYHESCKVLSVPGAVRAKTEHYWVWGWDGMSSCYAYTYWGDKDYLADLLQMYMETADEEKGFAHCFHRDMTHRMESMIAAQGFYLNLLYQYYMNGGDITPYYGFAKKLFDLICSVEVERSGMCKGYSLFPDFRNIIGETGEDISTFNNSSLYCALRGMQVLAEHMQDVETLQKSTQMADGLLKNFHKLLFNPELGYYYSSVDANFLEPREVYFAAALKWDNPYCKDLMRGNESQILNFYEENLVCSPGLRPFPVWGTAYDADSNQAHSYWPAHSETYTRLVNIENRNDLMEQFIGWVSYWTDLLTCPEGINCYVNTSTPAVDDYNSLNGAWQAYSMRAWYEAVVHSVVGVEIGLDGLVFHPYSGAEMSLEGLHYRDKIIDIHMKGSGPRIKQITANGQVIRNADKVSNDILDAKNVIIVERM